MAHARIASSALLLTLTACTSAPGGPAASPTAPAPAGNTTAVTGTVIDCGAWTLGQGEALPTRAGGCLRDAARDRRPARLVVTAPTVEGDPIVTTYVTRPDGRVEVTTDARQDRFGSGRIERRICAELDVTDRDLPVGDRCSPSPA
ncbi:DUF4362 domain-containing protein [Micromonospora coxensis]|uniref:DUF4362 domain-containing protein n=1 Tax=Micromonospora coxensis TaxID=356852 RepID=UPI00343743DD